MERCPNVHVTWYPLPSIYPSLEAVAPKILAISLATLGFSAMQTIIYFLVLFINPCAKLNIFGETTKHSPIFLGNFHKT